MITINNKSNKSNKDRWAWDYNLKTEVELTLTGNLGVGGYTQSFVTAYGKVLYTVYKDTKGHAVGIWNPHTHEGAVG